MEEEDSGDEQVDAENSTERNSKTENTSGDFLVFVKSSNHAQKQAKTTTYACSIRNCGCRDVCGAYFPNPYKQNLTPEERAKEEDRLNKWKAVCERDVAWVPLKRDMLGWVHFDQNDISTSHRMRFGREEVVRRLSKTAVPIQGRIERIPFKHLHRKPRGTVANNDKASLFITTEAEEDPEQRQFEVTDKSRRLTRAATAAVVASAKSSSSSTKKEEELANSKKRKVQFDLSDNKNAAPDRLLSKALRYSPSESNIDDDDDAEEKSAAVRAMLSNDDAVDDVDEDMYIKPGQLRQRRKRQAKPGWTSPLKGVRYMTDTIKRRHDLIRAVLQRTSPSEMAIRNVAESTSLPDRTVSRILRVSLCKEFPEHARAVSRQTIEENAIKRRIMRQLEQEKQLRQNLEAQILSTTKPSSNGGTHANNGAVMRAFSTDLTSISISDPTSSAVVVDVASPRPTPPAAARVCSARIRQNSSTTCSSMPTTIQILSSQKSNHELEVQCTQLQLKLAAAQRALASCQRDLKQLTAEHEALQLDYETLHAQVK